VKELGEGEIEGGGDNALRGDERHEGENRERLHIFLVTSG
jgi:hypothetical protein